MRTTFRCDVANANATRGTPPGAHTAPTVASSRAGCAARVPRTSSPRHPLPEPRRARPTAWPHDPRAARHRDRAPRAPRAWQCRSNRQGARHAPAHSPPPSRTGRRRCRGVTPHAATRASAACRGRPGQRPSSASVPPRRCFRDRNGSAETRRALHLCRSLEREPLRKSCSRHPEPRRRAKDLEMAGVFRILRSFVALRRLRMTTCAEVP